MRLLVKRTEDTAPGLELRPVQQLINETDEVDTGIPVNVYRNSDGYRVEMLVPGFRLDNLEMELDENGILSISATAEDPNILDEEELRKEFELEPFVQLIQIPFDADMDEIEAFYENGVVTLLIPQSNSIEID